MRSRRRLLLVLCALLPLMGLATQPAAALSPQTSAFQRTWERTDKPVSDLVVSRTWTWGPGRTAAMWEDYADSPGGQRLVQYFDKSRMEITDPYGDPTSEWYVTNGLLATELISGQMQLGHTTFWDLLPASEPVAGDPDDVEGPTYATFNGLLHTTAGFAQAALKTGVRRDGSVYVDDRLAGYGVGAHTFAALTQHWIADPFWDFMNASGTVYESGQYVHDRFVDDPYYMAGLPITDPFWARVKVGGVVKDVLVQCFERRCLTYTPTNAPEWRVEMGNIGQHYYRWRYGAGIPDEPLPVDLPEYVPLPALPLGLWPVQLGGVASVHISNQAPYPLTVWVYGPTSQTFNLPACDGCQVYPGEWAFEGCRDDVPEQSMLLPPGNYRVQVTRSGSPVTPLGGYWTLVPDAGYSACFYVTSG